MEDPFAIYLIEIARYENEKPDMLGIPFLPFKAYFRTQGIVQQPSVLQDFLKRS
jgi:hypothetical protein